MSAQVKRSGPVAFSLCERKGDDLHECGRGSWHLIFICESGAVVEEFHGSKKDALASLRAGRQA